MKARAALADWLEGEEERQLAFLQAFTRIDTCNPPGDTTEAAALFAAFLDEEGIPHRTEAPQPRMPNLVSSFAGVAPGRHLVLNGHLDVFPTGNPAAWARPPLSGDIEGGRLHGRGTVDMKAGTTALLFVHAYLHRLRDLLPGRVTLTIVSDEETGGRWAAQWLLENCAAEVLGDCVLSTEPSGLHSIRFGEKAMLWLRFRIRVQGGHSAYPHTGASANRIAAALVRDLEGLEATPPDEPESVRRVLDRPAVRRAAELSLGSGAAEVMRRISVNIGVLRGGVAINMLPDECLLDVDLRLPVGITRAAAMAAVTAIAARHAGTSVEELLPGGPEANCSDPEHEMLGHLARNAAAGLGHAPQPVVSLGGTDTRFWRARCARLRLWLFAGRHGRRERKRQHRGIPACPALPGAGGLRLSGSGGRGGGGMTGTTLVKKAGWVVAWDAPSGSHAYLTDADLAFAGDRITFVGRVYRGPADQTIDGRGLMVMPGLVDLHAHPSVEPFYRGFREEHGVPSMYMTGLYERAQAFGLDPDAMADAATVGYCELLLCGVTSVCDQASDFPGWLDTIGASGLRRFVAPGYASAQWVMTSTHELKYHWNEAAARQAMDRAIALMDAADRHESGRLSGVVYPAQIDTCSEALLRDSIALARDTGRPITTHVAQGVLEFLEMVRRHGRTPVQWASDIGLTGAGVSFGHAIFIDDSSWVNWASHRDLEILAETGTTVAHCPSPFARYGQTLESFGRYRAAGINMGMGTDVAPHNLLEEMRLAIVLGRVADRDIRAVNTADVFHAATVGGARALLRDDIGHLAPGAKADLVLVDLDHRFMQPARDPLRCLVYTAADRAVRDVFVDGRQVVRNGRVLTLDHAAALARLAEAQARMARDVPRHDFAGRTVEELTPLCLPLR